MSQLRDDWERAAGVYRDNREISSPRTVGTAAWYQFGQCARDGNQAAMIAMLDSTDESFRD